jgi:hypothetical protein
MDMDIVEEDDPRTKGAPNEWIFALKSSTSTPMLFCAIDDAEMDVWVDEMTQRIRAYQRIKSLEKTEQPTIPPATQPGTTPRMLTKKSRIKMEVNKMKELISNRRASDASPRG